MLTPPPPVPGDNWPVNRRGLVRKFINVFAGFFQLVGLLLNESQLNCTEINLLEEVIEDDLTRIFSNWPVIYRLSVCVCQVTG